MGTWCSSHYSSLSQWPSLSERVPERPNRTDTCILPGGFPAFLIHYGHGNIVTAENVYTRPVWRDASKLAQTSHVPFLVELAWFLTVIFNMTFSSPYPPYDPTDKSGYELHYPYQRDKITIIQIFVSKLSFALVRFCEPLLVMKQSLNDGP